MRPVGKKGTRCGSLPTPFSTIDQRQGSTLVQLASKCDRSFIVAARQILAKMTLPSDQQEPNTKHKGFGNRRSTHKPPSIKIPSNCTFRLHCICMPQINGIGRNTVAKSATTLIAAGVVAAINVLRHVPGVGGSQALCTGVHWKMDMTIWAVL